MEDEDANIVSLPLPTGTLVRIRPTKGWDTYNNKMVAEHGHLWVVDGAQLPATWVWCKSIATGYLTDWYTGDIEAYREGAEDEHA